VREDLLGLKLVFQYDICQDLGRVKNMVANQATWRLIIKTRLCKRKDYLPLSSFSFRQQKGEA
jgi:ribosomal 30S subunit maturation factor RimM